jgi:leucyl aminopeptidase
MDLKISLVKQVPKDASVIYLIKKATDLNKLPLSASEVKFAEDKINQDSRLVSINSYSRWHFIQVIEEEKPPYAINEELRKAGNKVYQSLKENKIEKVVIDGAENQNDIILSFTEGLALSHYQFLKYFKDIDEKRSSLQKISILNKDLKKKLFDQLISVLEAVYHCRNLINEPLSHLTAQQLAKEIQNMGKEAGFTVEVFNKKKIEALKMGGLLAVNRGSVDPPTFSILEWKPEKFKNKKPLILVGKGIVFDTGGLSLKPTKNSMDYMKSDMSGAAAVAGVIYAISKARLPVYVIGLIPATDNRPDGNAYVPGDIIKMYNGLTVEVLNTDAEGRMILADALSYGDRYKPELVIDIATLTGAAAVAIGKYGIVCMGNADRKYFEKLEESGNRVYERIVEFPFWDEYNELLKSDVADVKNIGGRDGGAITAGKFLERFTKSPYIHLDIAGPAFLDREDSYRGKGGTGVSVRLLFDFITNYIR